MPQVFISANSNDYEYARYVHAFLQRQGIDSFFCEASLKEYGDSDFKSTIKRALDECFHLVLVTTSAENTESRWVKWEWDLFEGEQIKRKGNILVVRKGPIDLERLDISLRQKQILDYDTQLEELPRYLQSSTQSPPQFPLSLCGLCAASVFFALVGSFILPAGMAALGCGLAARRKLRVIPGKTLWRWVAWTGILVGMTEVLVILSALLDGFARVGNSAQ